MLRLSSGRIAGAIYPAGFYRVKARHILGICRDIQRRPRGRVPPGMDDLLAMKGVGRKTANLVRGRAERHSGRLRGHPRSPDPEPDGAGHHRETGGN